MSIFSSIQAAWLPYIRRKESCGIMRDNTAYEAGVFAVVDTETNWDDEVMSIGVVAADAATIFHQPAELLLRQLAHFLRIAGPLETAFGKPLI